MDFPNSLNQEIDRSTRKSDTGILSCCESTIEKHAEHNPMMVCSDCKQIIKCFREERPYNNYLTFCRSRHRQISYGQVDGLYVVIFKSYETFR